MTDLRRGQVVRARFGAGVVEGKVIEVREEPTGARRVIIDPVGEDVELDTAAARVERVDRICPACEAAWERAHSYRCPACGTDLVES